MWMSDWCHTKGGANSGSTAYEAGEVWTQNMCNLQHPDIICMERFDLHWPISRCTGREATGTEGCVGQEGGAGRCECNMQQLFLLFWGSSGASLNEDHHGWDNAEK